MELISICVGGLTFIMATVCFVEDRDMGTAAKFLVLTILLQIFWMPVLFNEKIETTTLITNQYEKMSFEEPVKITKTRTYKWGSAFHDDYVVKVEFLKGE